MLSLGGVHHLTGGSKKAGGSKKEGRATCDAMLALCNGGATVVVQAGQPSVVNGQLEERMRVGCGSATVGMFAKQWQGRVDEVVVVDDHITGVLSEHQAGKLLCVPPTGIRIKGRRSTPGRYFQVAQPGTGWGGTGIADPLAILGAFDAKAARPGLTVLMTSTTGEHHAYFVLDKALRLVEQEAPPAFRAPVGLIRENCEPALATVLAATAVGADAATVIANAVDLPGHPAIRRAPAAALRTGSDLGDRAVTTAVPALPPGEIGRALEGGARVAERLLREGLIAAAAMLCQGTTRVAGAAVLAREAAHA